MIVQTLYAELTDQKYKQHDQLKIENPSVYVIMSFLSEIRQFEKKLQRMPSVNEEVYCQDPSQKRWLRDLTDLHLTIHHLQRYWSGRLNENYRRN